MRIFTNDYLPNIPGSSQNIQGGPKRFARDFSSYAVGNGHEWVGVIPDAGLAVAHGQVGETEGKRFFKVRNVKATLDGMREMNKDVALSEFFSKELRAIDELIQLTQPDIVYLNGFSAHAWVVFASARRSGIPVVIQRAGIFTREVEMYADLFTPAGRRMSRLMEEESAKGAAVNIFLNKHSEEAFRQLVSPSISNPVIIPLPHAGWPFEKIQASEGKEKTLGIVARWDRIKNQEAVLALAQEIKRRGLPWRIRSVTSIPETIHHAELKNNYRSMVEIVPPMDRDALRAFYESVDALILPSHFDVSPTVVMEAVAAGKPTLISPNVGWVSEYEACGMSRWIIGFGDPAAVIARLEEQFALPAWPEVEKFAAYIRQEHDPEKVFSTYLSVLRDAAASK